jgi:hypothetical protein
MVNMGKYHKPWKVVFTLAMFKAISHDNTSDIAPYLHTVANRNLCHEAQSGQGK